MDAFQKVQAVVDATPAPVSFSVMLGGILASLLQPIAIAVTIVWGCLQIHGFVEKKWGRDFLWLNRIFRKGK